MDFQNLGYCPGDPREIEYIAIDRVTRFPDGRELGLVVQQPLIAEKEIKLVHEIMNGSLFSGRFFMLAKSGHGSHSQAESLISFLFLGQKEPDEKEIHYAGRGVG